MYIRIKPNPHESLIAILIKCQNILYDTDDTIVRIYSRAIVTYVGIQTPICRNLIKDNCLKLNKENSFNNDCKVTFYAIFLIARLARLATLNSLSSLSRNSELTVFPLTARNSFCSL